MQEDIFFDSEQDVVPPSPSPQTRPTRPSSSMTFPPQSRHSQSQSHQQEEPRVASRPRRTSGTDSTSSTTQRGQSTRSQQQPPPGGGTATPLGGGTVQWSAFGQTVYVRDATKHPPQASFIVALIIGLACLGAVGWQMITTYSAFSNMIFDGKIWVALSRAAEDAARLPVNIICILIAVSFQAPLLFMSFKIDKHFAQARHLRLSMSAKVAIIWEGMKAVVASNMLLSIWAIIALAADTIGDVKFLSFYSDSSVVLFFYATGLYGLSTIGLSECLQILWDGMVTAEWLKHVRAANALATAKAEEMAQKSRRQS